MRRGVLALSLALSSLSAAQASLPSDIVVEPCGKNHFILSEPCVYSDPALWAWAPVAPMNVARSQHTATLLADGRVLVAGGYNSAAERSAEIYDPLTRAWTLTGEMTQARQAHAAVRLRDGRVLVMSDGTAEIYDPATHAWTRIASPLTRRAVHTMTPLADGRVLVAGGADLDTLDMDDNALRSAEIFDPVTGTWRETAPMSQGRYWHAAAPMADGTVLVAGGATLIEWHGYTAEAEIFDPRTETWSRAGDIGVARSLVGAVRAFDGSFVVTGGYSTCGVRLCSHARTDRYVPGTGWVAAADLNVSRNAHSLTPLGSGHLLAAGGENWLGISPMASVELYDPATNQWAAAAPLGNPRAWHTATLLANGTVLVAGGSYGPALRSAEVFAPLRNPRTYMHTR